MACEHLQKVPTRGRCRVSCQMEARGRNAVCGERRSEGQVGRESKAKRSQTRRNEQKGGGGASGLRHGDAGDALRGRWGQCACARSLARAGSSRPASHRAAASRKPSWGGRRPPPRGSIRVPRPRRRPRSPPASGRRRRRLPRLCTHSALEVVLLQVAHVGRASPELTDTKGNASLRGARVASSRGREEEAEAEAGAGATAAALALPQAGSRAPARWRRRLPEASADPRAASGGAGRRAA